MTPGVLTLRAVAGAAGSDGVFEVSGDEPWLEVCGAAVERLAGRAVEIRYRLGLLDEPVRPLIRFVSPDGVTDRVAAGPIAGSGCWIGRMPAATTRLLISPTTRRGPLRFAVESIRSRPWIALLAEGFVRRPRSARSAALTRLIGWRPEADNNLDWAIGSFALPGSTAWWRSRRRAYDPAFDGTPAASPAGGAGLVLIDASDASRDELDATTRSLGQQIGPPWRAVTFGFPRDRLPPEASSDLDSCAALVAAMPADGLVTRLRAGDTLAPHATAYVDAQAQRHREALCFFADHRLAGAPVLKPGWSRRLEAARPYLRHGVFLRAGTFEDEAARSAFVARGRLPGVVTSASPNAVMALRRLLVDVTAEPAAQAPLNLEPAAQAPLFGLAQVAPRRSGSATIIIPTKDNPSMLRRAVLGIHAHARGSPPQVLVVDNGSVTAEARALLAELRAAGMVGTIDYPRSFNFSAMCNEAAAASKTDVLVFLNDDTEVLGPDWLGRLVDLASQEDVGAVGAKLTFPGGRLQHVGVVLGMGGSAGHFDTARHPDDPGWMGRGMVVHEVSAVTGACLAVARDKFWAVGGFDEVDLPVELSDIDLCLKLNARGWQTLVDPGVRLLHEESASRGGATLRRLDVYRGQRDIFLDRWRHVIRDDPFFHPALSLYSGGPALA